MEMRFFYSPFPEAVEEDSALDGPCSNQEVEADRGPAVSF
jgi:hypothetical protein